jgi:predicted lipoprotein with Yx(FWY)xxD motif
MNLTNGITPLTSVAAAALASVSLVACGGGSSTPSKSATTAGNTTATVDVAKSNSLGNILVDSHGRTLYLFKKDSGTKSTCFGECATDWPPLRAPGKPTAGSGVSASSVATIGRSDGSAQVTYKGLPLYLFAGDSKPGDTNGQGSEAFGAAWLALSPAGNPITARPSGTSGADAGY